MNDRSASEPGFTAFIVAVFVGLLALGYILFPSRDVSPTSPPVASGSPPVAPPASAPPATPQKK